MVDIVGWLPEWLGGRPSPEPPPPQRDPQSSWDRDPDIKPRVTVDDAYDAARYKRQYGDPNISAIDIGDPYKRGSSDDWSLRSGSTGERYPAARQQAGPAAQRPITPAETDALRIGQLEANQMAPSAGMFQPNRVTLNTAPQDTLVAEGMAYSSPKTPPAMWIDPEAKQGNVVGHEGSHLGWYDLYYNNPEARKLMVEMDKKFINDQDLQQGLDLQELLARVTMQRNYGPEAEGKGWQDVVKKSPDATFGGSVYQMKRAAELNKDPHFVEYMRKLEKLAHHAAAQRTIAKQGGVFQKGGPVRKRFDPEGEDYDYDTAELAGLRPEFNPHPAAGEPGMRWPGRDPETGLQLKGRRHPTFDYGVEEDRKQGYGLEMRDGRYYTQPFAKHRKGGPVTSRPPGGARAIAIGRTRRR